MYTYVCIYKKKQERVTPCSGWLSVGSGGEESGEDTISEISYVYLSVQLSLLNHTRSKINQTKAEKKIR